MSPQSQPQLTPPPIHQAIKNSVILHRMPGHTSNSQGRPVIVHYCRKENKTFIFTTSNITITSRTFVYFRPVLELWRVENAQLIYLYFVITACIEFPCTLYSHCTRGSWRLSVFPPYPPHPGSSHDPCPIVRVTGNYRNI